ncbi:MAG TPA: hypothetical protein VGF82_02340 [Terracidiphilus sp.]|jgi:hypothetical protein
MKQVIHGLLVLTALVSAVALQAQEPTQTPAAQTPAQAPADSTPTADEIVAKHIEAIGGKTAIGQVKSLYIESSTSVMGNEAPTVTTVVDGVGYKNETDFNGTKIVQCYTDKGGWMVNPMAGATDPTPMPDDQYNQGKGQIFVGGPLYDYAAKGSKVELLGKDGKNYKIKLTTKDNVASTLLIDATTYYLTSIQSKGKMQDQDVDITMSFSDYRKTDVGFLIPYAIDIDLGQFQLSVAVKKVELNKTIDPASFEMPKPAETPKPAA